MSSQQNGKKKRGVRFTQESIANGSERVAVAAPRAMENDEDGTADNKSQHSRYKRKRLDRPNEDELDDIDDYVADDDDGDVPSESQTLRAKRERRLKQAHDDDESVEASTRIDQDTSLAAEGITIEPFHMREESSDGTGYFDGDTYIFRKRGAGEEPDAWLESIEDREDELIESSSAKPWATKSEDGSESSGNKMDTWTNEELYAQILPLVSDSETVMQAISRYGKLLKHNKAESSEDALPRKALNDLTEAASALLLKGEHDIYQKSRKELSDMIPQKQDSLEKSKPTVKWEYQGSQDNQVHGPYTTQEMQGWIRQGYFVGSSAVMIRSIREVVDETVSMKEDLLSDLLEEDDKEEEEEEEEEQARPSATRMVKGEWTRSDQVEFSKYQ
jgi:CD2 antigen cytoplasmic tail-binding protein 2